MGLLRLFLAMSVAIGHLQGIILIPNGLTFDGRYEFGMNAGHAVMCFYVVSGFLISYALRHKYTGDGQIREFYRSRALRIYPLYWGIIAFYILIDFSGTRTSIVNAFANGHVGELLLGFFLIGSDWFMSFSTFPEQNFTPFLPTLNIAWTLGAEIAFYLMAPFILRSVRIAALVLIASLLVRVTISLIYGFHPVLSYSFFPATLMFFMLGHFARLIYDHYTIKLGHLLAVGIVAALGVKTWSATYGFDSPWFYLFLVFFVLSLPYIFEKTKDSRILNYIGDLTYPLYLTHLGILVAFYLTGDKIGMRLIEAIKDSFNVFWGSHIAVASFLSLCILTSVVLVRPYEMLLKKLFEQVWKPNRKPASSIPSP